MDKADCIVVGAGVVGLAVARNLALAGREVIVVERHGAIGMETSSRNSEVIHAGLYYPAGSLKAKLCVEGRRALYAYCRERAVPHKRCGKLVVAASEEQFPQLAAIHAAALANGCHEVAILSKQEAIALEPALSCAAAMHSPETGIIDSHAYMLALQGDAEAAGAAFAFNSCILAGRIMADGIALRVASGSTGESEVLAATVVNCAGLWAPSLARRIEGLDIATVPQAFFAKGNYFSLTGKPPFSRLIYPVPQPGGLGIHLTLDLAGQARFGPDVEWTNPSGETCDYTVASGRLARFYEDIRTYWPDLKDGSLQAAYAGVRPKLVPAWMPAADFLFASHGSSRYLGLYGIESPGLTASLAIAAHVAVLLRSAGD